jgi:hypothetical protein
MRPATPWKRRRAVRVNKYGAMAQKYWRTYLPARYSQISDPIRFFTNLGEQVSVRISRLESDLMQSVPTTQGEEFLTRVGRRNMVRLQAEEIALPEMVLLPPETEEVEEPLPEQWQVPSAQETVAGTLD